MESTNKIIFLAAIADAFRDEEDRELGAFGKIEIPEDGNMTQILTDLFYAFKLFYNQISGADAPQSRLAIPGGLSVADSRGRSSIRVRQIPFRPFLHHLLWSRCA